MKCINCKSVEMEEIFELPDHIETLDDHYFFQCPECERVEKIHYYTYEAMMDYEDDYIADSHEITEDVAA